MAWAPKGSGGSGTSGVFFVPSPVLEVVDRLLPRHRKDFASRIAKELLAVVLTQIQFARQVPVPPSKG